MTSTPSPRGPGALILSSPAFTDGGSIPARFTCDGRDVSPPLAWSGAPDGTAAFLLTMRDPDARDFLHWIAWNLPAPTEAIPEGASGALPGDAGEGPSDFGNQPGYRGPCPPSGTHRYVLTLYALPMALADAATTPTERVERAAAQIALATATLTGTYRRQ
jgi:Raf kinase inhibitor-like YbhB/YbcL family protein